MAKVWIALKVLAILAFAAVSFAHLLALLDAKAAEDYARAAWHTIWSFGDLAICYVILNTIKPEEA